MNHKLKLFIAASVLLNLLLVGIIFGNAGRYFMKTRLHQTLQEIAQELPAEKRGAFTAAMAQMEQDTEELHSKLRSARMESLRLLQAENFDKEAYLAQTRRVQELRTQMMQRIGEAVAELATQWTPEERKKLAEVLRNTPLSRLSPNVSARPPL